MNKIALVAGARTTSSRLPNKVLYDLGGKPAFIQVIERITSVVKADYVVVACTEDIRDDPIELFAKQYGIDCFRGPDSLQMRYRMAGDKLNLKDDDIFLFPGCDSVLAEYQHLPWMIEQMEKNDCCGCYINIPEGTLLNSFFPFFEVAVWRYERLRLVKMYAVGSNTFCLQSYQVGCPKTLIVNFPPEYLVPCSWGLMSLDYPPQAVVIKEIYRQLYKGSPIGIFDVCDLFKRNPFLVDIVPRNLQHTDKISQDITTIVQSVKLNTDFVEVNWKGDNDVKLKVPEEYESKQKLGG